LQSWKKIGCYVLSFSEEHNVYLQQDGFLDKELVRVADLSKPKTNQSKWSWDRIRSPYIKQADVLLFFEDHLREELKITFEFYESFTVHESSLSPAYTQFKPLY
jgi:maltose phosphorylase